MGLVNASGLIRVLGAAALLGGVAMGVRHLWLAAMPWVIKLDDERLRYRGVFGSGALDWLDIAEVSDREGEHQLPSLYDNFWIMRRDGKLVQVAELFRGASLTELLGEIESRIEAQR